MADIHQLAPTVNVHRARRGKAVAGRDPCGTDERSVGSGKRPATSHPISTTIVSKLLRELRLIGDEMQGWGSSPAEVADFYDRLCGGLAAMARERDPAVAHRAQHELRRAFRRALRGDN
jgi:hypothetical protein